MTFLRRMEATERAEAIAVVTSVVMAAGMISVALVSGSVAVLAEGIDTCVDIITSIAVIIGFRLAARRSTDFPYGLYKIENLVTLAIAVMIFYSAYELGREAIGDLMGQHEPIAKPFVAMVTMALVAVTTGALAWNKSRVGRRENSPSLAADGRHSWTDAIASAGIVLGVGIDALGVPYVDAGMALVIAAILAWSGVQLGMDGARVLLDASLPADDMATVVKAAGAVPGVLKVVRAQGRNSGRFRFVQLAVIPLPDDLRGAEDVALQVRKAVSAAVPNVEGVQVELVPLSVPHSGESTGRDTVVVAVPLTADGLTVAASLRDAAGVAVMVPTVAADAFEVQHWPVDKAETNPRATAIAAAVAIGRSGARVVIVAGDTPAGVEGAILTANGVAVISRPDLRSLTQVQAGLSGVVGHAADPALTPAADPGE